MCGGYSEGMQRRHALPLILLSPLALNGCGFVVVHTARKIYQDSTQQKGAVEQALARYREALLNSDASKAAAFYTEDAQLSQGDATPLSGRLAILSSLKQPEGWRMLDCEWKAASTDVDGQRAKQRGSFRQQTVAPQGQTVEVQGRFDLHWARQGGDWRITRLHTDPA